MKRDTNVRTRAFSLIELLVVILIIALIVAIVLPALSGVRAKSREMATRNLLQNVSQAISAFQLDNKRLPGRFAERDLGLAANGANPAGMGLTSMENVMLDLAGGEVPAGTTPLPAGSFKVGPHNTAAQNIDYHPDLVGKGKYFTPPAQHFTIHNGSEVSQKIASDSAPAENMRMKDLVDAEGMPIILWMSDSSTVGPIVDHNDMARVAPTNTAGSRFYWNSNAAFLNSTRLGKKGVNQQDQSLIGFANANRATSLAAILGAPGSPKDVTQPCAQIYPSAPRGSFVLHAAGRNGVFLGNEERGAAGATAVPGNNLFYGMNFKTYPNTELRDDQDRPTSTDIIKDFDDLIVAGS
ncbi:MAG TPA: prepilin-type N-terminal cleavage/methylation domain-containing protein [Phycisphaerales bacterium]|nr:prepilin-type N-terminal cleavage/methylation domain-containing protein [Phycisphaerales bacterium]